MNALAMVLLDEPRLPTAAQLEAGLPSDRTMVADHAGGTMLALTVDDSPAIVGLVPAPIPWSQLEGPCATAWWWPEATEVCKRSHAHLLVTVNDDRLDALELNLRLTAVVVSVVSALDAPAVYWGAGTLVVAGESFVEQATSATRDQLPLYLWVDFRIERQVDGRLLFATTGLETLGHMEIEALSNLEQPDEVVGLMFNLARYLCDRGPVIADGNTFGVTEEQRVPVRIRDSTWNRGKVYFLTLE